MLRKLVAAVALLASAPGLANQTAPAAAHRVEITVTEKGFEPDRVVVKKGDALELVVTRKTDDTCAKKITIPDAKVKAALPLNEAVTLKLTPAKAGELKYVRGMGRCTPGSSCSKRATCCEMSSSRSCGARSGRSSTSATW
jgi:plastocyanin domain-containing protein